MSFAYPRLLFLLFLIPAMVVLYILARRARRRKLSKFGKAAVISGMMRDVSPYKPVIKFSLTMAALACMIVAVARPWGGVSTTSTSMVGMEVVIAVDASNSMLASATGNPQDASRMTTAKIMLERLIENMTNDRVGLVMFAGEAYSLIPASSDFASAKSFLNSITPSEMPVQGTDIEAAIEVARASFSKKGDVGKAIVLLTDVEDLDDPDAAIEAVKNAAKDSIQVNVIGVGSKHAVTIPYQNGLFRDESGNVVHTQLNEDLGRKLAKAGAGVYVNASSTDALPVLQKQLRKAKQTAVGASKYVAHDELYVYFVALAILLLVVEALVSPGKNRWLSRFSFFSKGRGVARRKRKTQQPAKTLGAVMLLLTVPSLVSCVSEEYKSSRAEREAIEKGNKQYADSAYSEATEFYEEALENVPSSAPASFNHALSSMHEALTLTDDTLKAMSLGKVVVQFDSIARTSPDKSVASRAFYNAGNIRMISKDYPGAIDYYKRSLRINPEDSLARRNLRIAQLNLPPKQNGGGGGDNDQNQKQDQDQNKDKQPQQQQPQQQQPQQQRPQQSQPQQPKRGEANADRILQRAQNKENEVRRKLYRQNQGVQQRSKNW